MNEDPSGEHTESSPKFVAQPSDETREISLEDDDNRQHCTIRVTLFDRLLVYLTELWRRPRLTRVVPPRPEEADLVNIAAAVVSTPEGAYVPPSQTP
jgi:hypothetical protein